MMKGFKIYIDFLTKTTNYYILVGDYTFKLIIMIIIYFHIKLNILFLEPNPYQ